MNKFNSLFLAALAVVVVAPARANAAPVSWQSVQNIAAGSDVDTVGSSVLATYYSGASGTGSVNGVTFISSGGLSTTQGGVTATLSAPGGIGFYAPTGAPAGNYSAPDAASYTSMLNNAAWSGAGNAITLTLTGLTLGQSYGVQFWSADYRGYGSNTLPVYVGNSGTPDLSLYYGLADASGGSTVIGSFTADSTTQSFSFSSLVNANQINAFQLLVVGQPPTFTNPTTSLSCLATSAGVVSYQVPAINSPTGYTATGLPSGLSLNTSTGLISGTVSTVGTYYISVTATNAGGTAADSLILLVPPASGSLAPSGNNPPQVLLDTGTFQTIQPWLDNTLLINPGKGYAEYYGAPTSYTTDNIGVGYLRVNWSDVEPSEGVFNWTQFDNLIAGYAGYGKKVAIGVINTNVGMGVQYATPAWVFQSGTNPVTHTVYPTGAVPITIIDPTSPTGTHILPASWDDAVYVARMKEFITAFGARYNSNPNVAFIEPLNYGNCGEANGNIVSSGTIAIPTTSQVNVWNDFYYPYVQAFPNVRLIEPWTNVWFAGDNDIPRWLYAQMVAAGGGVTRDGICSYSSANGSECLTCYPSTPSRMEYFYDWNGTVASGTDANTGMRYDSPGELLMYIAGGRPSYMQFMPGFCDANPAVCKMLGNLMGYHFVLQQAVIPKTITANVAFPLGMTWFNDGVAPLYETCNVAVALLDTNNNVSQKQWLTTSNPKGWMPGTATTENYTVTFTTVPTGYKLAVGFFVNQSDANPTYKLGIQGRVNNGWYILSGSTHQVAAKWTNAAGGSWNGANWTGFGSHSGIDLIADFSTLNLTANATVTLDGNVTVGSLLFGDTTPSNNWILNTGTTGALTLKSSPSSLPAITVNNQTTTINTTLTGNQGLVKSGSGTLVLNGTNTFFGNTTINGGVLEVTTNTSLYTVWAGGAVTINTGGTLQIDGWVGYSGGGTGEINQADGGNPNNLVINGGTLRFVNVWGWNQASSRALSVGASGGTLMNSSSNSYLWQLSLAGITTQDTVVNNSSLTLSGTTGSTSQIDKAISGTGSLTKTGAGTWMITGSNNYTGSTTVSAGNLTLSGSITSTASVSVASGATMNVTGKLYAAGNITNNGTMIFSGAAPQFGAGGTITNNGTILNNSSSLALPTIVNNGTIISVPPSPWVRADIGTVGLTGSATYLTGTYTVMGGGAGITSSSDAFCYTYQTSSSDCSVVARVASITNTNASAKGGVMIRDTTAAGAMEAGVWVTPSSGIIFTYRKTTGATTSTSSSTGKTAPYWVKITRTGNSFAGYYSTNGTSWTQLGSTQTISMGTSATIGLGVTSNVSATLCTSKIDSVTATP